MSKAWEVDLGAEPEVLNVQKEMQKMQKESWLDFGTGILAAYPLFELFHRLGHRACYCYHHHFCTHGSRSAKGTRDHVWHNVFRIALERITLLTLAREAVWARVKRAVLLSGFHEL